MGNYSSTMDILDIETEKMCCNSCISQITKNSTYINIVCSECNMRKEEHYHNNCYSNHMKCYFQNGFVCSNCIYNNLIKT